MLRLSLPLGGCANGEEMRERSRVMWEAGDWNMPKIWMSKKKSLDRFLTIMILVFFLSLPSKTSLFNEMAPAKKIYVTNGNTPRNATGRQGTARPVMLKINPEKVALISFKPLVTIHSVYFCIDKCSTWL